MSGGFILAAIATLVLAFDHNVDGSDTFDSKSST
jgi:hypothetical protein